MRGRPPELGVPRDQYLRVRLSAGEVEALDRARGEQSRSEFAREAIEDRVGGR